VPAGPTEKSITTTENPAAGIGKREFARSAAAGNAGQIPLGDANRHARRDGQFWTASVTACRGNIAGRKCASACAPVIWKSTMAMVLLAKHKAQYRSGNVVFLRGQYSGLTERNGIPVPFPCANKKDGTVEVRELSVYDQLLGGASCG